MSVVLIRLQNHCVCKFAILYSAGTVLSHVNSVSPAVLSYVQTRIISYCSSKLTSSTPLCRGLQLFQEGALAACTDGRLSAGPLDLTEYLAQQPVQEVRRPGGMRYVPAFSLGSLEHSIVRCNSRVVLALTHVTCAHDSLAPSCLLVCLALRMLCSCV